MMNTRLNEIRQSANPPFIFAGVGFGGFVRTKGSYSLFSQNDPKKVNSLIAATLAEISKIQNGQIEDKDLAKVKEARLVKLKEDVKRNDYWGLEISRSLLQGLELFSQEETEARINSIKKEDLQAVAKKYLDTEKRIQIVLMPEEKSAK